jgi:hypothetical protein
MKEIKKLHNHILSVLYGVQVGWFPKRGTRKTSNVGVSYFGNFPAGIFKTYLNLREKFTFVISERAQMLLNH